MEDTTRRNIIAVDVGGTKVACGIVTFDGTAPAVRAVETVPTDAQRGGRAVLATVIAAARTVREGFGGEVVGIGVSSAGVVDPRSGVITFANDLMPGWGGMPLGPELEHALDLPTSVMGDVHAHALGEARWGAGRDYASCLVVAVGTGIGGAFVERGSVMLGAHNVAGHVGHVACAEAVGIPCACGAVGHLEPVASGPGIAAGYARLTNTSVDGREVARRAASGDLDAVTALSQAGRALGSTLGSLCNVLDPAVIILSGSVAASGQIWREALDVGFASQAMTPVATTPVIMGLLGGNAPLVGAAENHIRPAYAELRP